LNHSDAPFNTLILEYVDEEEVVEKPANQIIAWSFVPTVIILSAVAWFTFILTRMCWEI